MISTAQICTEWVPSPNQSKVLETALECGLDRNITTIAKASGIARRTIYNWFDEDADFKAAWDNLWSNMLGRHVPSVVSAMIKQAQGGSVSAAKLVLELAGVYQASQKIEHSKAVTLEDIVLASMKPVQALN